MRRREFIGVLGAATGVTLLGVHAPGWAQGVVQRARSAADRVLILVELKGGNDGLNTLVPYADDTYYKLRKSIAIKAPEVIKIDSHSGLHPALAGLMPLWEGNELAIVQGVGYANPSLSHFRSIEIWTTASQPNEYLDDGWATRAVKAVGAGSAGAKPATEGIVIGGNELGPLAGARAVTLSSVEAFAAQSLLAMQSHGKGNPALEHLMQVENDISDAATLLRGERYKFRTAFPQSRFGIAVRAAAEVVAVQRQGQFIPVITLTLGSFDTHQAQPGLHAILLRQLAEGLSALREALVELGKWDRTLVMTFSEFGRRPLENASGGTDHGTAAPHFITGGAVRGGLYGKPPLLTKLDNTQNFLHTVDFRQLYTAIAQDWWGVDAGKVVRGQYEPVKFLRT